MALTFKVTREDMLRSKVLNPAWYVAKVVKVWQETAKSDGESTNTWIEFSILSGPDQEDGSKANDTPVRRCFSEKAPGFILPYLKACGTQVKEGGGDYDIEKSVGIVMELYIVNRMWEGSMQNDVKDFRRRGQAAA